MSENKSKAIPLVLKITNSDTSAIIDKVMIAIPDRCFYDANPAMIYDLIEFIANNYILFQAQENIDDNNYVFNLTNFINNLILSIEKRYYY